MIKHMKGLVGKVPIDCGAMFACSVVIFGY